MRVRAAAILLEAQNVLLVERHWDERDPPHYYVFPGGGVEENESAEEACVREIQEEVGLTTRIVRLVAKGTFGSPQPQSITKYFLVDRVSGTFGTGEWGLALETSPRGSYKLVWIPAAQLPNLPVVPRALGVFIASATSNGWPDEVIEIRD